jgi:hypothetical protein
VAKRPQASSFGDAYKGGRLKIIGGNAQRPPHFIIVQPEIKSLADLKGTLMSCMSRTNGQSNSVLRLDLLNSPDHTV